MVWMGRTRIVEVVEEKLLGKTYREQGRGNPQPSPGSSSCVRHWNMVAEAIGGRWTDHARVRGLGVILRQAGGGRVT